MKLDSNILFNNSKYILIFDFYNCINFNQFLKINFSFEILFFNILLILENLLNGIKYLHSYYYASNIKYPILHRCLFPNSFYIQKKNGLYFAKITNFQFSIIIKNDFKFSKKLNSINYLNENLEYNKFMAPEILHVNCFNLNHLSSDIYSFGFIISIFYSHLINEQNKMKNNTKLYNEVKFI